MNRTPEASTVIFPRALPLILLAALYSGSAALAQTDQPDENLPGFNPGQLYETHDIDNINLYSGDSGVVIPLGPDYPLGPHFTWGLKAYNSSKLWYVASTACPAIFGYPETVKRAWVYGDPTLGIGWTLDLGYVDAARVRYVSPDGARHKPLSPGTATNDGTRLRIQCSSSTSCTVESPDGIVETFTQQYSSLRPSAGSSLDFATDDGTRLGLTSITNRFGTTLLSVAYLGTYPSPDAAKVSQITLNPGTAQARSITYTWSSDTSNGVIWPVVSQIRFPSAAGSGHDLLVTFGFDQTHPALPRDYRDNSDAYPKCLPGPSGPYAYVPFLQSISFADSSTPSTVLQAYGFGYFMGTGNDGPNAVLNHLGLPTGGTIDYTFFGTAPPGSSAGIPLDLESSGAATGVSQRAPYVTHCHPFDFPENAVTTRVEKAAAVDGGITTSYARTTYVPLNECSPGTDDWRITRRTLVTEPTGNPSPAQRTTKYLFHGDAPTTRDPTLTGIEIERRYYADTNYGGTPVRTIVNCYDADTVSDGYATHCGYLADSTTVQTYNMGRNARLQASVTWYGANPTGGGLCSPGSVFCTSSVNLSSSYSAGALRYKTNTVLSTLPNMGGWSSRTTTTNWTPQTGTAWLLDLFSRKDKTDAGAGVSAPSSVSTSYTFDLGNGFLQNHKTIDSSNATLKRTYTPDALGNPYTEVIEGSQGLVGSFKDTRNFQSGLVTSRRRTGVGWNAFDVTREPNTGAITKSRDPSLLETSYGYDALGRITRIDPPVIPGIGQEASTTICYVRATDDLNPALAIIKKQPSNACSRDDGVPGIGSGTFEGFQFDGLGRLLRQFRRMPNALSTGSYFAVQETRYDSAGHRSYLSEWLPCSGGGSATSLNACISTMPPPANPGPGTTWSDFDVFDRARRITRADGTVTTISFDDPAGPGNLDTFESVTTTVDGHSATTVTRRDVLGRIISVTEPDVGQGSETTIYSYNALDTLAGVNQGSQTRSFVYDAFGFLRSETTPERGVVTYGSYDALGDPLTKTDGGIAYAYAYDPAGRLLTLDTNEGGSRRYLAKLYDETGRGYSSGRLTSQTATNYAVAGNPVVTDSFAYSGLGGRLSDRTTTTSGGSGLWGAQRWFYNALGLVAQHNHARASGLATFSVGTSYGSGMPVALYVNGIRMVNGVSYDPSGSVASYRTGIGTGHDVTTTITQDPSRLPRPASIATSGASSNFATGTYTYDGVGNVLGMTPDVFHYDARSRLTSATLGALGTQPFTYDRYGNLLTKGSTTFCVSACPNNHVPAASYDAHGNLVIYGSDTYVYDALDRMAQSPSSGWRYLYDGSNERAVRVPSTGTWTYTFRDENQRVSSEFAGIVPSRDNVFFGNRLIASYANSSVSGNGPVWSFYSSDHLGTPRLITDLDGRTVELRKYWPYGEDAVFQSSFERLRFASMERDPEGNRYYDHARSHDFGIGRFLSSDSVTGRASRPASWNRYTYASNNPLKLVDPNGLEPKKPKPDRIEIPVPDPEEVAKNKGEGWVEDKTQKWVNGKFDSIHPEQPTLAGSNDTAGDDPRKGQSWLVVKMIDWAVDKSLPGFVKWGLRLFPTVKKAADALDRTAHAGSPNYLKQKEQKILNGLDTDDTVETPATPKPRPTPPPDAKEGMQTSGACISTPCIP